MNAFKLPRISRSLLYLACGFVPLAQTLPAHAQQPAGQSGGGETGAEAMPAADAATGSVPAERPPVPAVRPAAEVRLPPQATVYVPRRRAWSQGDRITFAVLAAGVPGSGQLLQGRWLPGTLHLGGAASLGALGIYGWSADNGAAKWLSALGLLGLSIYSPIDAYFATPPESQGPGGRR